MKIKKGKFITLLFALLIIVLTACSSAETKSSEDSSEASENSDFSPKEWRIGHVRPADTSTDTDVAAFVNEVLEKSDGNLKMDIYPASQLGDYTVVQERVSMGDIEFQLAPAGNALNRNMELTMLPYLVTNYDEAFDVYGTNSELMSLVDEMFEEENIKLLAPYPKYFGGIALKEKPNNPADLNISENLKLRVPPMKIFEETAQTLGFIATPVPFSEAFAALQTGIVDGVLGSGAEGYYSSFRDLTNYYLPVNSHFEVWYLYMSKKLWDSLSDEEQIVIQEAANEFSENRFAQAESEQGEYVRMLEEGGAEIIQFSQEEVDNFAQEVREKVWPKLESDYDSELFKKITNIVSK